MHVHFMEEDIPAARHVDGFDANGTIDLDENEQ